MNLSVLTADQSIFEGAITSIKVPGVLGEFQVLNNHAPIVSALQAGKVTIKKDGGEEMVFDIEQGFIEVLNNEVSLLVQGVQE
ncbi:MAG: ATP synthase F1 subunit epsilon [Bacteroidota bacterium]